MNENNLDLSAEAEEDDDFLLVAPTSQPTNSFPSIVPSQSNNTDVPTNIPSATNQPSLSIINETAIPSISPTSLLVTTFIPTTTVVNTTSPIITPTFPPTNSPTVANTSLPTSLSPTQSSPTSVPSLSSMLPTSSEFPTGSPSSVELLSLEPTANPSNSTAAIAIKTSSAPYFTNNNIIVVACLSLALFLCILTIFLGILRYQRSNLRTTRRLKGIGSDDRQSHTRLEFSEYLGDEPDSDGSRPTTQLMAGAGTAATIKGRGLAKTKKGIVTTNPMTARSSEGGEEFYC